MFFDIPLDWWRALGNATASRQFYASCTGFQCGSASSSRSPLSPPGAVWACFHLPG